MPRLLRAATLATAATLAVLTLGAGPAAGQEPAGPAPAAAPPNPVVSVHGYSENGARLFFSRSLRAAGYPADRLFGFAFDSRVGRSSSNRVHAQALETYIREVVLPATGAEKVDIIAHSMGSLLSRHCIKVLGCGEVVDDWVSLGGPNHGTIYSFGCRVVTSDPACGEMRPGSAFLRQLNAGDETPGPVDYTTIRSRADLVVVPTVSVTLQGATNHLVPGLGHNQLAQDPLDHPRLNPLVRDLVLAALAD